MAPVAADPPALPRLPANLEAAAVGDSGSPAVGDSERPDGCVELELIEADFADRSPRGLRLDTVRLTRVDASGARLAELRVLDAELTDCNLANVDARAAVAGRVAISRSRLTGITLREAEVQDLAIADCRIDLASFASSRLTRVTFDRCLLTEAAFIEAHLDSVRFDGCELSRTDFRGARLRRCEFRGCDLTQIDGVASLRGAAIDWPTIVGLAGVWAAALGIGVLDDDRD